MECCPLKKATGKKICEAFEELVISRWGTPEVILTDNGTEFKNHTLRELAETYKVTLTTTPPYHPQANPVERVNRILKTMIISFLEKDHRDWDLHLSEFRFAYNTSYHSSLHTSPAFLNFGRNPKPVNTSQLTSPENVEVEPQPPELWVARMERMQNLRDWVTENLDEAFARQAKQYDRHHRPEQFAVGDLVLKRHHVLSSAAQHVAAKLAPRYHGPFKITKVVSRVVYEVWDPVSNKDMGRVHIKDLKRYHEPLVPHAETSSSPADHQRRENESPRPKRATTGLGIP